MPQPHQNLIPQYTSGALLARNTLWNLLAFLAPVVAGLVAIPLLIRGIGTERFGVLSLAWIVLGYVGLFDLGLGRALTKLAAEKIGAEDEASIAPMAWTSLLLLLFFGVFGSVLMCALSPWLVHRALKIPVALQAETLRAFFLLGASVPITMITSGLRGLLEALQRFKILSFIRVTMTVFSFGGPLLVLPFSRSLVPILAVLVAGRFVGCIAHWIACFRVIPAFRSFIVDFKLATALFRFGSWLTVSNLIGPAMNYIDRFLIGGLLSLTAVTYYTAPFDMLTRLSLVPAALMSVLFPAFAAAVKHEPGRAAFLFARGVKYILISIFPLTLIIVTLSPEILRIWLGTTFEQNSFQVLRLLSAAIFLNCLAQVPFTFIQSAGRPDVTAKLIAIQFPFYFAAVWFMTAHFGIGGTAWAWVARVSLEAGFLFFYVARLLPPLPGFLIRLGVLSSGGLAVLYFATRLHSDWTKVWFLMISLTGFAIACWHWALRGPERFFLLRAFGQRSET